MTFSEGTTWPEVPLDTSGWSAHLDGHDLLGGHHQAGACAVVQVDVADLHVGRQRRGINRKVVVLSGDLDAACAQTGGAGSVRQSERADGCCGWGSRGACVHAGVGGRACAPWGAGRQLGAPGCERGQSRSPGRRRSPVGANRIGWLPPWWPNGSLKVVPPSACPSTWCPMQMPNTGFLPMMALALATAYGTADGSPCARGGHAWG